MKVRIMRNKTNSTQLYNIIFCICK